MLPQWLQRFDREELWLGLWLATIALSILYAPQADMSRAGIITSFVIMFFTVGKRLFPQSLPLQRLPLTALTLIGIQSLLLTLAYYLSFPLTHGLYGLSTIASMSLVTFLVRKRSDIEETRPPHHSILSERVMAALLLGAASICFAFVLFQVSKNPQFVSIRSPWPYLHALTPLAIALIPLTALCRNKTIHFQSWYAIVGLLSLLSLPLISILLYSQGYGFDGFLHRESISVLITTETLHPKPLYYMGYYTFIGWLHYLTSFSIAFLDAWSLPAICFGLVSSWLYRTHEHSRYALIPFLLIVPLGWLATTTPQSMAIAIGLMAMILVPKQGDHHGYLASIVLSCWSLAIHPLAGLPFAIIIGGLYWNRKSNHTSKVYLTALASGFAVPAAFIVFSLLGKQEIRWDIQKLLQLPLLHTWLSFFLPRANASLWPDWTEVVRSISSIAIVVLAFYGNKRSEHPHRTLLTWSGISIVIAGTILRTVSDFTFLISYERTQYADRLMLIGLIVLCLPATEGLALLLKKQRLIYAQSLLLIFLAVWQSARIYDAYPRHDSARISHGWSTSRADMTGAAWIDQNAQGKPYIVLANQSMSAAAVQHYGFRRYIPIRHETSTEEVFYYPIPTGGWLYQYFLRMASDPHIDDVKDVGNKTQSSLVYVVIHDYWWNAKNVRERLDALTPVKESIENDALVIYRFDVSAIDSTSSTKRD